MSRKVFTAGEVLAAADVNSFLMDQTVMSFAGTAARGSAIPTPVEGMYTHLEDTDRLEFWNGSAWRSPTGLTLLATTTWTAQTGVNIQNVFTSEFDNYRIIVNANVTTNVDSTLRARLLSTATEVTTNYTSNAINYRFDTGAYVNTTLDSAYFLLGLLPNSVSHIASFDFASPFLATATTLAGNYTGSALSYDAYGFMNGRNSNATSYDGIRLSCSASTFTGTARVYGYRNA
jgi:hypothetical protein